MIDMFEDDSVSSDSVEFREARNLEMAIDEAESGSESSASQLEDLQESVLLEDSASDSASVSSGYMNMDLQFGRRDSVSDDRLQDFYFNYGENDFPDEIWGQTTKVSAPISIPVPMTTRPARRRVREYVIPRKNIHGMHNQIEEIVRCSDLNNKSLWPYELSDYDYWALEHDE